jgi:plasmid replication initiation protein
LKQHQISKEIQITNEHQIYKKKKLKETQSTNVPKILNERQIFKQTQSTTEPQILKQHKISKEMQIMNGP